MKKRILTLFAATAAAVFLAGCSPQKAPQAANAQTTEVQTTAAQAEGAQAAASGTGPQAGTQAGGPQTEPQAKAQTETKAGGGSGVSGQDGKDGIVIRVGGLKGPTTMGLVKLMDDAQKGISQNQYEFTMVTAADELTAMIAGGKVDIALLPANVAGVLFNKTKGGVTVIDINTLGVLYLVSSDSSVSSIDGLKGRTIYLPGKGTTPEYALRYLLSASGLSETDVTLEFKSEATEVAAVLAEDPTAIGLLPQPFVTVALAQNDTLSIILDLTKEWDALQAEEGKSRLVTGVTIVNTEFLAAHEELVKVFLDEHRESAEFTEKDADTAAEWIAEAGIVAKAPLAKQALPYCNITCITGEEMKAALSGYLKVLFGQNPASVGKTLPDDSFYYIP
ncbi:MAG: ABC transporter substrate-binding protein [Lachnospiraceae bacterium]|nr:ABC transporter substrate-binding protein [Lachnospiraceae bacterium]